MSHRENERKAQLRPSGRQCVLYSVGRMVSTMERFRQLSSTLMSSMLE